MAIALHMRKVSSRPQSPSFLGHVVLKRGAHYKFNLGGRDFTLIVASQHGERFGNFW